mgnify:CR=1 FL=1
MRTIKNRGLPTPIYKHTCKECIFLGIMRIDTAYSREGRNTMGGLIDLYFHKGDEDWEAHHRAVVAV